MRSTPRERDGVDRKGGITGTSTERPRMIDEERGQERMAARREEPRDVRILRAELRHTAPAWAVIEASRAALDRAGIRQWDDTYPTRAVVESDISKGTLYVLEDAGTTLACITLDSIQDPAYARLAWTIPEPALVVHRLCVDPAAQGRGLARELMAFAERFAWEHDYRSIRLDAFSGNPRALGLYRRRGYSDVGEVFFPRRDLPFRCFERAVNDV